MDELEKYCVEHGWTIDSIRRCLRVFKKEKMIHRKFEIAMDINSIIKEMKDYDFYSYGKQELQVQFPFVVLL